MRAEDEDVPDDFLATSAADFAARFLIDPTGRAEEPGSAVGRYRLIEEIGRGGMGVVWLAERSDGQFEQRVALKLIRRGMDSPETLDRFLRERQILARLEHPNIARLLDGGVSDDGRPWFVMEHVAGTPITTYCDRAHFSSQRRLQLFMSVCHAVQYAHRNLVVHRDIKPANVLINETGEVRLLDFGVATVISRDVASATSHHEPMTPVYASPEQRAGHSVNTASDIFQLGLLLTELLTARRGDATAAATLPGDLRVIATRALDANPERRYPSAELLAEDVRRYLAHLPIQFSTGGWRYTAAKAIRRNRVAVAIAALIVVAISGTTLSYLSHLRAERDRARGEAAKVAESFAALREVFHGWNPDAADRDKVSVSMLLGDAARRARIGLASEPAVLATTLSVIGDLENGIGQWRAADSLLTEALLIQRSAGVPTRDLAATLSRRGSLLLHAGRLAEAEQPLREALSIYQRVSAPGAIDIIQARRDLAEGLWRLQRLPASESLLRSALMGVPARETPIRADLLSELGYVVVLQGRYREAVEILRPTRDAQRRMLGPLNVSTLTTMRRLASALRGPEAFAEAELLDRESLQALRTLFGESSVQLAGAIGSLAVLLEREGKLIAADSFAREAVAADRRLFGDRNDHLATMLRTAGSIRLAIGDTAQAEQLLRSSLAAFHRAFPNGSLDEGDVLNRLASILLARRAEDADAVYQAAVRFERRRAAGDPLFVTDGYEYLGDAALAQGDTVLAAAMYRRAVALYEAELPRGHPYRAHAEEGMRRATGTN